jgi:hypothetical protein
MTPDFADDAKDLIADVLKEYVPAPWGKISAVIVSRYGKKPLQYFLPPHVEDSNQEDGLLEQPNFAVIGMGRCGSNVAMALHEMVFKDAVPTKQSAATDSRAMEALAAWVRKLRSRDDGRRSLSFKPVMLVGDTDATTFGDIAGLIGQQKESATGATESAPILKLSYFPLANAGVGNNPIISQYFTRALLSSPDNAITGQRFGWGDAKRFLLSVEQPKSAPKGAQDEKIPPRLAFYIFGAGGGTGCGAAGEILRAQQFAGANAKQNAVTYYCAVAVLPEPDRNSHERKRMLNMARFVVQYLAEQSIVLRESSQYSDVPRYNGGSLIALFDQEKDGLKIRSNAPKPIVSSSWNSVLLISNEIMRPSNDAMESVLAMSNRYIAQQVFNLAGPQISARNLTLLDTSKLPKKNYQAVRLDAMDLLASLRGPCACCFAAATVKEVKREQTESLTWVRELFLRAVSLPIVRDGLIEGISLGPTLLEEYRQSLADGSVDQKLERVSKLPFFAQCGSVVFTLTAPQDGTIMQSELQEIMRLLAILFPNVGQTRYSAIYGTTDQFTLSLYIEGSVVFAPEIERAVKNYFRLCWPKGRKTKPTDYQEWWKKVLSLGPPIQAKEIIESLGDEEYLDGEYPGLSQLKQIAVRAWDDLVRKTAKDEDQQALLSRLTFDDLAIRASEASSALAFYNYFAKREWLQIVD